MKEVIMYECEFCKKRFRSKNLHKCKFDPNMKNCFSCGSFTKFEEHFLDDTAYFSAKCVYPVCDVMDTSLQDMSKKKWKLDCIGWELRQGYTGKQSYKDYCIKRDMEDCNDGW